MKLFKLNPLTVKRWRRFRSFKRAWISLWALLILYVLSLCSELLCNNRPLILCHDGHVFFPVFCFYSADEVTGTGGGLAPDYRALAADENFDGWFLWPLHRSSPDEQVPVSELDGHRRVLVYMTPVPGVGTLQLTQADGTMGTFTGGETLLKVPEDGFEGHRMAEFWVLPEEAQAALRQRFENQADDEREFVCKAVDGSSEVTMRLLAFKPRRKAPTRVTVKVFEAETALSTKAMRLRFNSGEQEPESGRWPADIAESERAVIQTAVVKAAAADEAQTGDIRVGAHAYKLLCERERIEHPFRPVPGHWLGMDDAGRDVLARVLYGLRTSLTFGLILVVSSMLFGTMIGCIQGYLGGIVDLMGQRAIEIWSALPFLYIVILMGSLFGTGFWLLIVCYALFNWIGISYYMRAEMLRLRRLPFVESARCLGLPWWLVVVRHILPNALVPLVTFFPFSLVGAVGALAGLDYLGFGLPPPTPSLGQLLQQAQAQREAWWLIVYPSAALFVVMLLCVFIGEGVREAFDPKRQSRLT